MNQRINILFFVMLNALFSLHLGATATAETPPEIQPESIVAIYFPQLPSAEQLMQYQDNFFGLCTELKQVILPSIEAQVRAFFTQLRPDIRIEKETKTVRSKFVKDAEHALHQMDIAGYQCVIKKKVESYTTPLRQKLLIGFEHLLGLIFFSGNLPF